MGVIPAGRGTTKLTGVRDHTCAAKTLSAREIVARLKVMIAEAKEDDEKRKQYFGYFETSEGDLY